MMSGALSGLVFILVKDDIDQTVRLFGKLMELKWREVGAEGAGGIAKTGLPEPCQIEPAFDQDHGGELANRFPGEQAAPGAGEKSMRGVDADTAAIEVDNLSVLAARGDNPPVEGIAAPEVDEAVAQQ